MKELEEVRKAARERWRKLAEVEADLEKRRNLLYHKREQLAGARRLGKAGGKQAKALEGEIAALESKIEKDLQFARALKAATGPTTAGAQATASGMAAGSGQAEPWELVEGLDDRLPFLLLPVRIETRFMAVQEHKELWVRIFPDDIAVHTHERNLTPDEVEAGRTYWRELWRAQQESEAEQRQLIEKGAWRALAEAYGGGRAAWIAGETRPVSLEVASTADLQFPDFGEESLKAYGWSQAPRSKIMPDRFVVMAFSGGKEVLRAAGSPIPDPLMVGPDPQRAESEFRQEGGELLAGEDIAWIYDFPQAVQAGMGLQIELAAPFDTQGFDQLLVLGLRLSSDEKESQALLEELFENHSYAPDGLSLLPQGTPTNNTERQGSGFSSADPGAETSFAIETGQVQFEPMDEALEKKDGQRLVEALGTDHELFQRIQHAGGSDARQAQLMNRALWNGTLGYYLEQMLDLEAGKTGAARSFFTDFVTGRGPLPAIRVGSQPYGVLLSSDFSRWRWSQEADGADLPNLQEMYDILRKAEQQWRTLLPGVARTGKPGDPFENLLDTLGLQAASAEFYRRHAVGREYLWNYAAFSPGTFRGQQLMQILAERARSLAQELGINTSAPPTIYSLAFFRGQDLIDDPLVDDIGPDEAEKLSETRQLPRLYRAPDPQNPGASAETNYIGWLAFSNYPALRAQRFENMAGEAQPMPRPLLYRLLRAALLQTIYDAALSLYTRAKLLPPAIRREVELSNIQANRTVTPWELMDADISKILPGVSQKSQSVAQYLYTEEGLNRPTSQGLREVRQSLQALADLHTAELERAFVEHIDLCSYRLDAWQTGCFNRRLQQQRFPPKSEGRFEKRTQGIYLGAFGWLEDLRPAPDAVLADLASIPASLHDPQKDGPLFQQAGNAGFIHAPSLNHAVTAAILRNAYLTHFDPAHPGKMAVDLSSERVRSALAFLEGVRNGQELGALLGYQFERGLHDRYGDPSLNQYIPFFRQKYALVADKILESQDGEQVESKEARNVFDGYALLEAVFIQEPGLPYPYGVDGLPEADTSDPQKRSHVLAIQAEVARMAESLDAIADLALAEGVYQVAQGNHERAGAMLKALTQGESPADPEIARTPRSGTAITQRVALHLPIGTAPNRWPGDLGRRAEVESGLNTWLGDLLPPPGRIRYKVRLGEGTPAEQNLASLGLQPIDLVYMTGDDLAGATTELEARIAFENRRKQQDDALQVQIDFMAELSKPQFVTLFELLPLLRALRQMVTSSRPLVASDYQLPSEATSDPAADPNPEGVLLPDLKTRMEASLAAFEGAVNALGALVPAPGPDGSPDPRQANAARLRLALRDLAEFGVPDAFPRSAAGSSDEAKATLTRQAVDTHAVASRNLDNAKALKTAGDDETLLAQERVAGYRACAQAIFGAAFNLIPLFDPKNAAELQAAMDFREADPGENLTRHHQDNPLIVDEWLHGAARVQPNLRTLESIYTLGEIFGKPSTQFKALQLPFRQTDYWVAVAYPQTFLPEGEYVSVVQALPETGFQPVPAQSGLLVDEWNEVIPSQSETSGIAFHYNQPNSEPPQVLLLAVTPEITGTWTWDKLTGILQDTLERARLRAVEPDQIGDTALGQLLPAILTPVASRRFATISTDLVYRTAVQVREGGG